MEDKRRAETVAARDDHVAGTRRTAWFHRVQLVLDVGAGRLQNGPRDGAVAQLVVGADRVRQPVHLSATFLARRNRVPDLQNILRFIVRLS